MMEERKRALHAAKEGNEQIVKALIDEAKTKTPPLNKIVYDMLSCASANNHTSVVANILSLGINVDGVDHKKHTALYSACRSKHTDLRIIKLLIDQGADVNKIVKGRSPLTTSCHHGRLDLIEFLIQQGASLHQKTPEGYTPLAIAVYQKHIELCKFLLNHGAPVDDTTEGGFSSLMISAYQGTTEISDILINAGANMNKKNDQGFTPLMLAAQNGHVKLCEFLLQNFIHSDSLNACNDKGFTPLMLAADRGHLATVQLLLSHMDNSSTETLVQALMLAVNNDHNQVVEYLLAQKKISLDHTDHQGIAALHISAQRGNLELSELLLKHGAKADQRTSSGRTPLMFASSCGHSSVVEMLVAHKAELEFETVGENGYTALDLGVRHGQFEVVKVLVEAGASVTRTIKALAEIFEYLKKSIGSEFQNNKLELAGCASQRDCYNAITNSNYNDTSSFSHQPSVSSDLDKFETAKCGGGQLEMKSGEVRSYSNTLPTCPTQSKLVETQRQGQISNPHGVSLALPCGRLPATLPVFNSTRQDSAESTEPISDVKVLNEKEKDFKTDVDATTTRSGDIASDKCLGRLPDTEKQAEDSKTVPPPIEREKGAAGTSTSAPESNANPKEVKARNSVSGDGHVNTQGPVLMSHSASAPAIVGELMKALASSDRQPFIYIDQRTIHKGTISITDAETVGLGEVNIRHQQREEPEDPDTHEEEKQEPEDPDID